MNSFNEITSFSLLLHFFFMFILLISSITLLPLSSHACHEEERRALLDFKSALNDTSNRLSSWQESFQRCCDWYGIKCSNKSLHVVSIDLRNTNLEDKINKYGGGEIFNLNDFASLQGKLSPSLSNITRLEYLDLAFNDFQESQIPFRFSKLSKLTHLDLSNTKLSASVSTAFPNLSSLHYLDLSCETISIFSYGLKPCLESSSTEWMRGLTNIQVLRLSGIDLFEAISATENFSDDISYLWNLRELDISSCNISGPVFPIHHFHNLSHLSTLKMNYNSYLSSSIPVELANLTSLSILQLSSCELQGPVPEEIIHLQQLQTLDLSMNNLTGPIPEEIIHLQQLRILDLSLNNLTGPIPQKIIHLQQLRILDLSMNNLSGPIPKNLGNLSTLTSRSIPISNTGNSVQYKLATKDNTAQLEQFHVYVSGIDLSNNVLDGNIPEEIGLLQGLAMLNVSYNLLSSSIPESVGNMSNLESLDLSSNKLSGHIPQSLTSIDSLQDLNVSYNNLRGRIPRGDHFDTLSSDGSAFVGNELLCGFPTEKVCDGKQDSFTSESGTQSVEVISKGKAIVWKIVLPVFILVVTIMGVLGYIYLFKRNKTNQRGRLKELQGALTDLLKFKATYKDTPDTKTFTDGKTEGETPELQIFNFACLSKATNNFCLKNKLGEGGFGPVYKGELLNGQEIAVKRLSTNSGQGIEEFRNEVVLISKLQHRNLVKLLGCCAKGKENMLIYEYMPKGSLDAILFDPTKKTHLDWDKRFNIIGGIARGLLYLHRDSRLRVIHRDLKASNILLDENIIPKISDFGMARIFGGDQIIANTSRVVGTFGYMSPEYIMGGTFSEKSDVFSYGVLVLEIVSGKKNNSFYNPEQPLNLLLHTWRLWNEGKWTEVVEEGLSDLDSPLEVIKCIHIGLLCVQNRAVDRPTMAEVDFMLTGETDRPAPKEPPYTLPASSDKPIHCSNNLVTLTAVEGR